MTTNARDAMSDDRRLTIEARDIELDDACACLHPAVRPGWHGLPDVDDTGTGMDAATIGHMVVTFFTAQSLDRPGPALGGMASQVVTELFTTDAQARRVRKVPAS